MGGGWGMAVGVSLGLCPPGEGGRPPRAVLFNPVLAMVLGGERGAHAWHWGGGVRDVAPPRPHPNLLPPPDMGAALGAVGVPGGWEMSEGVCAPPGLGNGLRAAPLPPGWAGNL